MVIGLMAGLAFVMGHSVWGGLLAQLSSVVDGVDGDLARLKGMTSRFGAFFDAVLDRYADAAIILVMTVWAYRFERGLVAWVVGSLALLGAIMISYSRARAEASVDLQFRHGIVSLASRDVRLFVIMLGSLMGWVFWTLAFIAILTNLVVVLRILFVRKATSSSEKAYKSHECHLSEVRG